MVYGNIIFLLVIAGFVGNGIIYLVYQVTIWNLCFEKSFVAKVVYAVTVRIDS